MAHLLAKLRIDYSSLIMLQGITDMPKEVTIRMHNALLEGFKEGQNDECFISDTERMQLKEKTNRQLRLREMLLEHSRNATIVMMSMPVPRKVSYSNRNL
jgi:solute carrier family 12 sodium/potassium/chloride transporter 2